QDLRPILNKGYVELFQTASTLQIQPQAAQQLREQFKSSEDACRRNFRSHSSLYSKQIDAARAELKKGGEKLTWQQRHVLHCRIQNLQMLKSEADILASHAIPTAYDNLGAKLDLLQQWPEQHRMAVAELSSGIYQQRRWADVKDIGFRQIAAGQKDDIRRGQQAVEEMRRTGLLPPPLENKAIQAYVRNVAMKVAHNSDLQVPLHIEVINSREINAFALPGGYLFIERGLLDAADDESELAGVIAHEIAHDTARHAAKLMKRATIAGIFYQAAQVAAIVLTGGVAGIGMYYALQYGFYGLGMVLNLKLLGVSRDYELEADQLGVQYAWKAGYDTSGFIRFFDKIATKKGYINGASWFRTHPPFYQRMVLSEREIMFLPKQAATPIVQTPQFEQMKKELAPIVAEAESEDANKPTLLITREEGCKPPRKIEYKPGQPIEDLCATPPQAVTGEGQ
ncbi:MAG: M48 family metalloprotease, partial [Acidobacteriota bacterium]